MHARLNAGRWLVMASVCFASACASKDHPTQPVSTSAPTTKISSGPFHVAAALVTAPAAPLVYVALPPDSIPAGITATISDPRTGSSVTATMVNGGFDPVALSASVGDTLTVTVYTAGAPLSFDIPVPEYDPPIVVRTDPVPVKRDVPLNATIVVVFSQPIRVATLTSGSMQLLLGGTPVAGQLSFTDGTNLVAQFVPAAPLVAGASYELVVTQDIQDWNGNPLKAGVTVPFTTTVPSVTGILFTSVSAGWGMACGLTQAGAAYCWGQNAGAAISGSQLSTSTPNAVAGALTFTMLSVGTYHACGLTADGAAYCWGNNDAGQLGDGTTQETPTPVAVAGGLAFTSISAGVEHTCGLTRAGAAYCWGYDEDDELGDGNPSLSHPTPVAVAGGLGFVSVSAGSYHTCGLTAAGAAYCWGDDSGGALGDGTRGPPSGPRAVVGGLTFTMLSAGDGFTCGLVAAGTAYCWGDNNPGAPGAPGTDSSSTALRPLAVPGGLRFSGVSASPGNFTISNIFDTVSPHACGTTVGGAAWCWGDNTTGGLGNGLYTPILSATPVAVAGGLAFASVSAGAGYSCGRTTDGSTYCWGANNSGQLGNATTTPSATPVRVGGAP